MKGAIATALVTSLWATSAAAGLSLLSPRDASPAVVGLQTQRKDVEDPIARDLLRKRSSLRKRQQTVTETLNNEQALYVANVTIGTPSQNFRLHLDTGSSDMWVNTPDSQVCASFRRGPCSASGVYNANSSSTSKYVSSNFNVSYVDGTGASGDYVTDNVGIGGKTLNALQFGVGYVSSSPEGILGIGYPSDEGLTNHGGKAYSNLPVAMVSDGLIKSNAYSIWLDDLEANTGSIMFGGVDTGKYHGSLQGVPVQKEDGQIREFVITLSGVDVVNGGKSTSVASGLPAAVILDTGSSITYLPDSLAQEIFNAFNVQFDQNEGAGYANCNLITQNLSVTFNFSSATITVPISELIINPANADEGNGQSFQSQDQLCLFGITSAQGNTAVLGDTFLRSAYIVFDLDNNEISLAQTNFNATTTSVQEIGTGTNSVPGATDVANPVEVTLSTTGGGRLGPATSTSAATAKTGGVPARRVPSYLPLVFVTALSVMIASLSYA